MKWTASRRILIFDLLLYMLFIVGMTAVILYSTKPLKEEESTLQIEEENLITMVLENYSGELERWGWGKLMSNEATSATLQPHPVVSPNTAWDPKYHDGLTNEAGRPLLLPFFGFLALFYTTVFLFFIFIVRELLELIAEGPKRYFSFFENIFEVFVICLTVLCFIFKDDYSENVYFYQLLQVATVFFGWLGLTLQLARFPAVGMYIQLSIMVFRQLVLSLMVFMTILLAFSFSFHLSLRKHHVYDNALTSFLKTITMMVGEFNFDYDFTFESVRDVGGSNGVVQALLMLFILMVTITIANLIIAIVIENISKMFDQAEVRESEDFGLKKSKFPFGLLAGAPVEQDGGADHDSGQREAHLAQVPPLPEEDLRQESLGEPSDPATSDLFLPIGHSWSTSTSLCEDY